MYYKKILFFSVVMPIFCLMLTSCKLSNDQLAREIEQNMLETWRKEGLDWRIAKKLLLTHKSNNQYSGIMTLAVDGEATQVIVDVVYDGDSFQWQIHEP